MTELPQLNRTIARVTPWLVSVRAQNLYKIFSNFICYSLSAPLFPILRTALPSKCKILLHGVTFYKLGYKLQVFGKCWENLVLGPTGRACKSEFQALSLGVYISHERPSWFSCNLIASAAKPTLKPHLISFRLRGANRFCAEDSGNVFASQAARDCSCCSTPGRRSSAGQATERRIRVHG